MVNITLQSPLQKISKTSFRDEKEMILYFINLIGDDFLDLKELEKSEVSEELLALIKKSKQKNISEFDNI